MTRENEKPKELEELAPVVAKKKEKEKSPSPVQEQLRMARKIPMTLEQWVQQLAFFANNTITIGRILVDTQQFIQKLHQLLLKWEKMPKTRMSKTTKKLLNDIRGLLIASNVQILKRAPPLSKSIPKPVPMRPMELGEVGGKFQVKPASTLIPPTRETGKKASIEKARATQRLKKVVQEMQSKEKELEKKDVHKEKGTSH